ncbi:hypothetical protein J4E91_003361 [Alternaria rosae]|nr:hypothetical protein J4E91_003361 [Alternaria rosae]
MYEASKAPVSKDVLLRTNVVMLVLTSGFVFARAVLQIAKRKPFELPDFFVYFAYCLFIALWACYHVVAPPIYRAYAVLEGQAEPYATMKSDAIAMLKFLVAGQICFYTLLISVKMSLMTLYRKLLAGLPSIYRKIWWGMVAFCALAWIGSITSTFTTCDDLNAEFREGQCGGTPDEDRRVIFSLYFAYSVDVATDLAIMFLPLHLTWNLQMPRKQKIGMFILFGSGFVCIAFATLRCLQVGVDGSGKATTPEPKWLMLWNILECSIAIMIACSPAFASFIRKRINTPKPSYNAQGYFKQGTGEIKMKSIICAPGRAKRDAADIYWDDTHSSQEELAGNSRRIIVKTTVHQDDEVSSHLSKHLGTRQSWTTEVHSGNGRVA